MAYRPALRAPDRHVPPDCGGSRLLDKLTLGFTAVLPAGTPARATGRRPLAATGPYMIVRYRPGHELRLARNPRFRESSRAAQPDGFPDAIAFRFKVKGNTAVTDVERGRADDFAGAKNTSRRTPVGELQLGFAGRDAASVLARSTPCSSTRVSRTSTTYVSAGR